MNGPARGLVLEDAKDFAPEGHSWKVGVYVKAAPKTIAFNGLRFADRNDAVFYGGTLRTRWPDVVRYEVAEAHEPPNCTLPVPSDRYNVVRTPPRNEGQERK